jgi:hypothetical protein
MYAEAYREKGGFSSDDNKIRLMKGILVGVLETEFLVFGLLSLFKKI